MLLPMSGSARVDLAIVPTSYAGATAQTSPYYNIKDYNKVIFICAAGSMTASGDVAMRLVQAPTATAPATASAIGLYTTMNGTPTNARAITKAIAVQVCGSSDGMDDLGLETLTINGVAYTFQTSSSGATAPTTADFAATRLVCASSGTALNTNVVAPYEILNHLAAYINHATYGVTGLTATVSAASSYLTITQDPPGDQQVITISLSTSSLQVFPTQMIGYLEVDGSELASSGNQDHVALEVTPSTHQRLSAFVLRYSGRYSGDRGYMVSAYDDIV